MARESHYWLGIAVWCTPCQAIVQGIARTCVDLGIDIIAEGVETLAEFEWLRNAGIQYYQRRLFAWPAFEQMLRTFHMP